MNEPMATSTITPRMNKSIRLVAAGRDEVASEADLDTRLLQGIELPGEQLHQLALNRSRIIDFRAAGAVFEASAIVDCEFERVDLSNTDFHMSRVERCVIRDSRLTGISLNETRLIDVRFVGCRINLGGFRIAKTTRLTFDQCDLSHVDFRDADLTGVVFDICNLTGADFSGAILTGADLRRSNLESIVINPDQLRSVTVTSDQALFLCGLLGLLIDDR